ncbi:LacI family DNA-binding transcriptional regulator [Streptomyces beihaiensis]|uniref:LacI family transcriptional regulator n=1 Tax=Streptomyces beihaiensis TaxID=2984495 RepID=A0ABT3U3N7_9ACTN|nr:LacI family DNA-binding transcriptional regulator [Streptomyces beihaiensis]MCX3063937.1 LacI family transcriptional regulator [Streptomyces beihaiensis]
MTSGKETPENSGPDGTGATRPTSRDVARAAGVSQAAVSLVMRDKWHGRVSAATADRVRTAARQLGYRPNLAARNLRLGRTRTALLVVPALTNEFFAGVYTGAARIAARHDFGVVLYPSPEGTGRARDPFPSASAALDGIIASSMAADAVTALRGDGGDDLPLVMLDSDPTADAAATVNLDLADGMRQLTEHLLARGHHHYLHVASAIDSWTFDVRARELAARITPLTGTTLRTVRSGLTVDAARTATERALRTSGLDRPTAIVCDDDKLAAGAYKAARRLGLRVPDQLSVTGFDDLALATAVEPELTTVRLPAEEFGERGMAALIALLEGRTPDTTPLPVRLVPRGSTAPAPPTGG